MVASEEELLARLEARDTTLWPEGNTAADRLGWLDAPRQIDHERKDLRSWSDSIDDDTVILLGMGGSTVAPSALGSIGTATGEAAQRRLITCSTSDPVVVEALPFEESFVLVTSKSGTTRETAALYAYARSRQRDPKRFAVITDPRSPLVDAARAERVHRVFENRPDVGSRYAALSYAGAVPAALLGYDLEELVGRAMEVDRLAAVRAGVAMAEAALEGRPYLNLVCGELERTLGCWIEHLVAASTGKGGRGIVPVPTPEAEPGDLRQQVEVTLESAHAIGAVFLEYEIATAIASHVLGVDPFAQPDADGVDRAVGALLGELPLKSPTGAAPDALWTYCDGELRPDDYVAVHAYLEPSAPGTLEMLRRTIRDRNGGVATTVCSGPQVLHTTGQLHAGGPDSVVIVQLLPRSPRPRLPIPGAAYDFATLTDAEAIAGHDLLRDLGRRIVQIAVDDPAELL